jgi:hypothetical protein
MRLYLVVLGILVSSFLAVLTDGTRQQRELSAKADAMAVINDAAMTVDSGQGDVAELMLRANAPGAPISIARTMVKAANLIAEGKHKEAWQSLGYARWQTNGRLDVRLGELIEKQWVSTMIIAVLMVVSTTLAVLLLLGRRRRLEDLVRNGSVVVVPSERQASGDEIIEAKLSEVGELIRCPRLAPILKELHDVAPERIIIRCSVGHTSLRFRALVRIDDPERVQDARSGTDESTQLALIAGSLYRM